MKNQCDLEQEEIFNKLLGLGETSVHKNYYSVLQEKIHSLEESERKLELKVKERTKQYEELNEKLEKKVSELEIIRQELSQTIERLSYAQTELIESEKMASLGTLVAGVAHEISNPINYAYISSKVLQNDLDNFENELMCLLDEDDNEVINFFKGYFKKFFDSINIILDGSNHTKTIVQDLRLFSRIDKVTKKEICVSKALETTVRLVKTQYTRQIDFKTNLNKDAKIECYPSQLDQVFLNIIINSCHAIVKKQKELVEKVKGLINISLYDNEKEIIVEFTDNGCGMTEEVKSRMFEPFFTTKPIGEGTGMGMAITYGVIERHNGKIEVKSQVGEGTKITIALPHYMNPEHK